MTRPDTTARTLRRELDAPGPLLAPGAGTPFEARLIEQAGFPCLYLSGYATAALVHGVPDIGIIGLDAVAANASAVAGQVDIPIIVDADTGYGDVANVQRTVRTLERLGAAAIQLEDQTWPKRCGHLDGKTVEPTEVMRRKIGAALAARRDDDTVIIARTDARATHDLDEAIARVTAYHEEGADLTFVDAPRSLEELREIGARVPGRKVANMSESGETPILGLGELGDLGFDLVLFPTSLLRIMSGTAEAFLRELREAGTSTGWSGEMSTLAQLNRAMGMDDIRRFERDVVARVPAR